jgi:MFS family permease
MQPIGLPLLIALLPLAAMAILQFILPVLAPVVMAEIGRPPEAYGWLGGAMGLGSILLFVTNNALMPALGPVRLLRLGLVIATTGILCVVTGIWPLMLLGSVLMGYGYATTTPAGSQVLADFTPRALWGTLFSLRMAAVPIGGIAAGLLGSFVAPAAGWRATFGIIIATCAAVFIALLFVPRAYNEKRALKPFAAREIIRRDVLSRPAHVVTAIPGLPSLALASWCIACVHAAVTSFFVIYLVAAQQIPITKAATLFAVLQVSAVCGRIIFGAMADRIGSPLPVLKLIAPMAALAAVTLSFMTAEWSNSALIGATLYIGATVGAFNGLYLAEVARLAPSGEVGDATASVAVFMFTAYFLAPPLVGLAFAAVGPVATLRCVALFAIGGFAIYLWRDRAATKALAK